MRHYSESAVESGLKILKQLHVCISQSYMIVLMLLLLRVLNDISVSTQIAMNSSQIRIEFHESN